MPKGLVVGFNLPGARLDESVGVAPGRRRGWDTMLRGSRYRRPVGEEKAGGMARVILGRVVGGSVSSTGAARLPGLRPIGMSRLHDSEFRRWLLFLFYFGQERKGIVELLTDAFGRRDLSFDETSGCMDQGPGD